MTTMTSNEDKEVKKSNRSYLHIQNLPWSACRRDIRDFFKDVSIKEDGILIRGFEAFVALENPLDMVIALLQSETTLHGNDLQLSVIMEDDLQKKLRQIAQRRLDFGHPTGGVNNKFNAPCKRKIRPTPVSKGLKRRALSSLCFNPVEVNLAPQLPQCGVDGNGFQCIRPAAFGAKKVHPTRVSDSMDVENFAIFHPEKCYEVKRLKLDVRPVCVLPV